MKTIVKTDYGNNHDNGILVFDDGSEEEIGIYEYHGSMRIDHFGDAIWIVYGHEEIRVYTHTGILIDKQYTR